MAENGTNVGFGAQVAFADPETVFGQHHDRAPFGRLVGQGGELGRGSQLLFSVATDGEESGGLAVAQGDRAGLVEQQGLDVAGGLHGPAAHGQDVPLH